MKKLTLAAGGVLGSQIGFQAAVCGWEVTFWMHSSSSITRTKPKIEKLQSVYEKLAADAKDYRGLASLESPAKAIAQAQNHIHYETDLKKALEQADLLIECVPEVLAEKEAFFKQAAPFIPENCLIATNTSSLLPSQMAGFIPDPSRFLAMHFANEIWANNTCEIMPQPKTSQESMKRAVSYAKAMNMIPLVLKKEQAGYLLNSMLIPLLDSAQALLAADVSDAYTTNEAWKLGTGAPHGPFEILDVVGLPTALNIVKQHPQASDPNTIPGKIAARLEEMVAQKQTFAQIIEQEARKSAWPAQWLPAG